MEINEQFIFGFIFAIIFISLVLGSQYGNDFNFLKEGSLMILPSFGEALNWKTLIFLSCFFLIFFKNIRTSSPFFSSSLFFRSLFSLMFVSLAWGISDILWIGKAIFMGNYLFGSLVLSYPSLNHILIGFSRDLILISPLVYLYPYLKFSRSVLYSIIIFSGFWLFLFSPVYINLLRNTVIPLGSPTLFGNLFFNSISYHIVGFLPFIVAFKEWRNVSWRKFLLF